ncbi:hypothetical protein BGX34_008170 [Mortierella sp. NVP85]|nr:hypothetical protein BGX34_008170 [Mortierella sp. NVP85]
MRSLSSARFVLAALVLAVLSAAVIAAPGPTTAPLAATTEEIEKPTGAPEPPVVSPPGGTGIPTDGPSPTSSGGIVPLPSIVPTSASLPPVATLPVPSPSTKPSSANPALGSKSSALVAMAGLAVAMAIVL